MVNSPLPFSISESLKRKFPVFRRMFVWSFRQFLWFFACHLRHFSSPTSWAGQPTPAPSPPSKTDIRAATFSQPEKFKRCDPVGCSARTHHKGLLSFHSHEILLLGVPLPHPCIESLRLSRVLFPRVFDIQFLLNWATRNNWHRQLGSYQTEVTCLSE